MWGARTPASIDVWLGRLLVTLSLDENSILPGSLPRTRGRLLLREHIAEAQTAQQYVAAIYRESPGDLFIANGEMSS